MNYGATINQTVDSAPIVVQSVLPVVSATTQDTPIVALPPVLTSELPIVAATTVTTRLSSILTLLEAELLLSPEVESVRDAQPNVDRSEHSFKSEQPAAVQAPEANDIVVQEEEAKPAPTQPVKDAVRLTEESEQTPAESESTTTTTEVVESTILAVTSGFLTYSLAIDQVLQNRLHEFLELGPKRNE